MIKKVKMQAQSIKRNFGDLTYFVTGSGPALLGLSGFGCSHYNYIDLLPELTKNFTVVLIGNRGIGESSKTEANYNLKDVACDALAVMDHLKVQTFGLMGISMGGFIAQELYALAPLKISAISFMCTLSSGADFTAPAHLTEEGLRLFDTFDIATQAEYSTMATVHPTLKEKNPAQYKRIFD
jgi:3-oxoadipate enol-lactonase